LRSLFDVSSLIALLDGDHSKYDLVSAWFARNIEQGWASCPLTQNGYLRIRSQPNYSNPVSLTQAYEQLLAAISTEHHQFIADDISLLDDTLLRIQDLSGHRQLTDVYLLALAVAHDARLVTLDTRIPLGAVRGASQSHLAVI
jgi:toxin-antitoxin system PIN domain toxin